MPTTRRSTARTVPTKGQSTLSFQGRVTKNVPKDVKDKIVEPAVTDIPKASLKEETATEDVKEEAVPAAKDVEEDKLETEEAEEEEEKPEVEAAPEKSESELKAEKITNTQVEKYWKAIEKQRIAPRVHQQDLDINEKVLRYFDVSSHYGPCIGITRMKRWQRADRLGLNPPIEVLAVLLKEEEKGNKGKDVAHMDQLMNSTAIGAA